MSDLHVVAPDGMPVRVLPLASDAFMGAAIGTLAPRQRYAVHYHRSLEQLSFVLRGRVAITMFDSTAGEPRTRVLGAGEAVTNPPGVTLSFANEDDEPAEVLFVCAPPFPPDDSEVVLTDGHRALTDAERRVTRERLDWALSRFRSVGEDRAAR